MKTNAAPEVYHLGIPLPLLDARLQRMPYQADRPGHPGAHAGNRKGKQYFAQARI
jgi:hypothetical protein